MQEEQWNYINHIEQVAHCCSLCPTTVHRLRACTKGKAGIPGAKRQTKGPGNKQGPCSADKGNAIYSLA